MGRSLPLPFVLAIVTVLLSIQPSLIIPGTEAAPPQPRIGWGPENNKEETYELPIKFSNSEGAPTTTTTNREKRGDDDNKPTRGGWGGGSDDDEDTDGSWMRCKYGKVLVCHLTPGHGGDKAFEICVSPNAVSAHLAHGDAPGPCPPKDVPCPDACDDVCPSACANLTSEGDCEDGVSCWDINGNGQCDLPDEDKNGDQMCTTLDCQGPPGLNGTDGQDGQDADPCEDGNDGVDCWDLNGNGMCDLATEDIDGDGSCTVLDCQGPPGNCTCPDPLPSDANATCPIPEAVKVCCYIAVRGSDPTVSPALPIIGELFWPAWQNCLVDLSASGYLPCLGQFVNNNPALCRFVLDKYGPGDANSCTLPDFRGMKIPQNML